MTTIELEPITPVWMDERTEDEENHDHKICHLYIQGFTVALCGLPNYRDWHDGIHPEGADWAKGMMGCPKCGIPICMDCLLQAS